MAQCGSNMTPNVTKWPIMDQEGPKNDPKWPKMTLNGPKMTQNDPKMTFMT